MRESVSCVSEAPRDILWGHGVQVSAASSFCDLFCKQNWETRSRKAGIKDDN